MAAATTIRSRLVKRLLPVSVPVMTFVIRLSITTKAITPMTTVTNPRTDNSYHLPLGANYPLNLIK